MYVARILYPVKVLGPGERIGIWLVGCKHGCKGCSNPELWEKQEKYNVSIDNVIRMIDGIASQNVVDGFTITGGDPMEQPEDLEDLLSRLCNYSSDIIMYTGYDYLEIKEKYKRILENVAVIIDGKYVEEENHQEILRGSSNQKIIVLKKEYEQKYGEYLKNNRSQIQNFTTPTGTISVGIHRPGYKDDLDEILQKKGLIKHE